MMLLPAALHRLVRRCHCQAPHQRPGRLLVPLAAGSCWSQNMQVSATPKHHGREDKGKDTQCCRWHALIDAAAHHRSGSTPPSAYSAPNTGAPLLHHPTPTQCTLAALAVPPSVGQAGPALLAAVSALRSVTTPCVASWSGWLLLVPGDWSLSTAPPGVCRGSCRSAMSRNTSFCEPACVLQPLGLQGRQPVACAGGHRRMVCGHFCSTHWAVQCVCCSNKQCLHVHLLAACTAPFMRLHRDSSRHR